MRYHRQACERETREVYDLVENIIGKLTFWGPDLAQYHWQVTILASYRSSRESESFISFEED